MYPQGRDGGIGTAAGNGAGGNGDDDGFTLVPNRVLMDLWAAISEIRAAVICLSSDPAPADPAADVPGADG